MKRIGLGGICLISGACALGTMSSKVEQRHKLNDGVERTVTAKRSGWGFITQQPLLTPGRESIDTAIAGAIDRSPGGLYPYGMYGNFYGPYSASGQIMPYGLGWAHPIGGYTEAGMARATELQPLISPATPTYNIIQAPPIPAAPPVSGGGGGGQGGGGAVSPPAPVAGDACVPRDLLETINDTRDAFLKVRGTKPLNKELARQLLKDWQADTDDAAAACQKSNPDAARGFEAMRQEIEKFRVELQ